jgi:uncharacterized membrane protein YgdD (TMEM256/DUF423 family)
MSFAWKFGSLSALTSVVLGAFGSHSLKQKLQNHPEGQFHLIQGFESYKTGIQQFNISSFIP